MEQGIPPEMKARVRFYVRVIGVPNETIERILAGENPIGWWRSMRIRDAWRACQQGSQERVAT